MAIQPQLPVSRYKSFRQQQEAVLGQHKAYAEQLKEKQAQAQTRGTDLDVAGRVLKVLNPTIPKSARQFLNVQLAQHVGVDPKSEQFKGLNAMIMGLDPGALQQLGTAFSQQVNGAAPGQILETTKGLMTGQIPLDTFLGQVDFSGGAGADQLMGGEGEDQPKTAQPFQEGPAAVQSFEGQRTVPAASQQASPMLAGALGLDSKVRYRNNDLITNGLRIPMEIKDQEKLAGDINTRTIGLSSTVSESANMLDLFEGRPETIGVGGRVARGVNTIVRQVEGFLNAVRPGTAVDDPDAATEKLANEVGSRIAKMHHLDQTAESSARIRSMVLGLAYRMAAANNIPGNRLTNGIIQQNLQQLGESGSPEQFRAVLKDTITATTREYDEFMRRTVGVNGLPILARGLDDEDLVRLSKAGGILPQDMAQALRDETFKRVKGGTDTGIVPQSPTLQEEERTLGGLEMQEKERGIAKTEQEMRLARQRDERAESAEERAESREGRMVTAQERSADLAEERLGFEKKEAGIDNTRADRAQKRLEEREDRMLTFQEGQASRAEAREARLVAGQEESQSLAREKFDYEKTQDRVKADQERASAIAKAFMEFGKAIANIGGGGAAGGIGGGAAGGGQDTGAFQLAPTPQRVAPRPAGGG